MDTLQLNPTRNKAVKPVADIFATIVATNISTIGATVPFAAGVAPSLSAALSPSDEERLRKRVRILMKCDACIPTFSFSTGTVTVRFDDRRKLRPDRMRLLEQTRKIRRSIGPVSTNVADILRELNENGER